MAGPSLAHQLQQLNNQVLGPATSQPRMNHYTIHACLPDILSRLFWGQDEQQLNIVKAVDPHSRRFVLELLGTPSSSPRGPSTLFTQIVEMDRDYGTWEYAYSPADLPGSMQARLAAVGRSGPSLRLRILEYYTILFASLVKRRPVSLPGSVSVYDTLLRMYLTACFDSFTSAASQVMTKDQATTVLRLLAEMLVSCESRGHPAPHALDTVTGDQVRALRTLVQTFHAYSASLPEALVAEMDRILYVESVAMWTSIFDPAHDNDQDPTPSFKCWRDMMMPWLRLKHVRVDSFISNHLSFYLHTFPLFLRRISRLSFAAGKANVATRYLELFVMLLSLFQRPIDGTNLSLVEHLRRAETTHGGRAAPEMLFSKQEGETHQHIRNLFAKISSLADPQANTVPPPAKAVEAAMQCRALLASLFPYMQLDATLAGPGSSDSAAQVSFKDPSKLSPPEFLQPVRSFESAALVDATRRLASLLNERLVPSSWLSGPPTVPAPRPWASAPVTPKRSPGASDADMDIARMVDTPSTPNTRPAPHPGFVDGSFWIDRDDVLHVRLNEETHSIRIDHTDKGFTIDNVTFFPTLVDLTQHFTLVSCVSDSARETKLVLPSATFTDRFLQFFLPLELRFLADTHMHARAGAVAAVAWALGLLPTFSTVLLFVIVAVILITTYAAVRAILMKSP
eukprot:m.238955 g.238955  ORF g.238955 m.238955 type:complete len:681 (+) comp22168_c0_seq1:118-2160(+)